jgi:hypothetical protein
VFLDDVSFDGPDRRAVYTMVDCHDGRMIPKSVMVHAGNFWEQVFIRVMDWAPIDSSPRRKWTSKKGEIGKVNLTLRKGHTSSWRGVLIGCEATIIGLGGRIRKMMSRKE